VHAIVLVGGFGTRLRPLTDTIPKSMLTVGNEPIVTRLVRRLERSGITTVTLSLGFLPDVFVAAFPDGRCGQVELRYAVEPEPLDTAGAIRFACAVAEPDDTFVVVNGDVITDLDVAALVAAHRRFGGAATLHLTPVADPSGFGVVEVDSGGRVRRFLEKPAPGATASNLINAGTYAMEPSVLDDIDAGRAVSVERVTFPTLAGRGALYALASDDYWLDVGRPELFRQANVDLLDGRYDTDLPNLVAATGGIDPAAAVAPGAMVSHSVVAPGVAVGSGTRVTGSVLLAGSSVGKDVIVEDSVVMGAVGDGAVLRRAVLGAAGTVEPGQHVTDERIPAPAS
jgi:mannose-1-phosphate guanylyltransferase